MIKRILIYCIMVILLFVTGCNQVRNKDTIMQLETNHFIFYSNEQDMECLEDLSNTLKNNYSRVTDILKTSLDKKIDVYIYSDLSTYHKAINQPNAPNTFFADADSNSIRMVNPLVLDIYTYPIIMKSVVHELVHVVIHNINSNIPKSLDEGIATYLAGNNEGVDQIITEVKAGKKIPTIRDLDTDAITFSKIGGYEFSYLLIEYTVKTYGYDKLIAFIKEPTKFDEIFGISLDDFEKEWIDYIMKN